MLVGEFCAALVEESPRKPIPAEYDMYSWLIGSWDFEWVYDKGKPQERRIPGEWYFSWIIAGQAIQDVFICPSREYRLLYDVPEAEYGTTIRLYNRKTRTWDVSYCTQGGFEQFKAWKEPNSDQLVQSCISTEGFQMRWVFDDIRDDAFHWSNSISRDDGKTWELQGELFATRRI